MSGHGIKQEDVKRKLVQNLWGWTICQGCEERFNCRAGKCPAARYKRLDPFLKCIQHYAAYLEVSLSQGSMGFTFDDVFAILQKLKSAPDITADQLSQSLTKPSPGNAQALQQSQSNPIRLAVRILLMVECSGSYEPLDQLERAQIQARWCGSETFHDYSLRQMPQGDHPIFASSDAKVVLDAAKSLKGQRLQKRARLKFKGTDIVSRHLYLDHKTHTVEIFHHTSFLKEHLLNSKGAAVGDFCPIPRGLALEILDSIQKVLFPFGDKKSTRILQALVSKSGFDPDSRRFESQAIRSPDEEKMIFPYLGERLARLLDEVENPRPHGLFEKWLERKSGARYVMLATLVGVLFAVLLGMAALCLSGYQTWIAYQAWKHPMSS